MSKFTPDIFRAVRHYAGKIRTIHNEIRTERFLSSLPAELRKDIGWPDRFGSRRTDNS